LDLGGLLQDIYFGTVDSAEQKKAAQYSISCQGKWYPFGESAVESYGMLYNAIDF